MSTPLTGRNEIINSEQVSQALDRFERLAITDDGWSALHCDPKDGRLWELTFPRGHLHGGGSPRLHVVSQRAAAKKYGAAAAGPKVIKKKKTLSRSPHFHKAKAHPPKPQRSHMPKRKVYHVTPHEEGWQVKGEGASRASSVHKTKKKAVSAGRSLAKKPSEGQIKIHKRDGTLETEHTYKNDPTSSPG